MLQLGINTVLFKAVDVKTALKAIKLAGYDGAELSAIQGMCEHIVLDAWETQAPIVKAAAAEAGVKLLSMEVASLDEERLKKAFEAARYLSIPVVNVGPGGKSDVEEDFQETIKKLTARAQLAKEYGVKLCCKAHVNSSIYSTPTTLRAMELIDLDSFGVDMDPSHIHRAGEKPEDALASVVSRMGHVHIRDCYGPGPSPGEPAKQACGRGEINLYGYFKALVDANYDGPVCLEVIGPEQTLQQAQAIASESYGYMNAILKILGAR
ncbi:MAG: sugar phosphate isomerase/epimerase [Clostridia bacterium]|nr:sugar phosphate isomerase/epimerase [Clostridia bacterium]